MLTIDESVERAIGMFLVDRRRDIILVGRQWRERWHVGDRCYLVEKINVIFVYCWIRLLWRGVDDLWQRAVML